MTIQALQQTPNLVIHAPRAPPERVLQYSVCKLQSVFLTCEELWPPCGSLWPLMVGQRLWARLRVMLCPGRVQDMCSTVSASPHGSLETPANEWEQTSIPMTRQLDGGSPWSGSRLGAPPNCFGWFSIATYGVCSGEPTNTDSHRSTKYG